MSDSAHATTRVSPNRSVNAAANGAESPNTTRLIDAAVEIAPWLQPNSIISGSIRIPNVARMAAAARSATNPAAATSQARCMAGQPGGSAEPPRVAEPTMFARFLPYGCRAEADRRRAAAPRGLGVLRRRHRARGVRAESPRDRPAGP